MTSVIGKGLAGVAAIGAGSLAYAGLYEVNAFRVRRVTVPVLPAGSRPIRVLHVSDIHMTPAAKARQRWLSTLGALEPDLVINTGDNLAHQEAVPYVLGSLGRLLDHPGVYVWGANDYYPPTFKNPLRYLTGPSRSDRRPERTLPWQDLGRGFKEAGWIDLTHTRASLEIKGVRLGFRGTDDAHIDQDRYAEVAARSIATISMSPSASRTRRTAESSMRWRTTGTMRSSLGILMVGRCVCPSTVLWSPTATWTRGVRRACRSTAQTVAPRG